jgi:hypothetical protein
MRRLMIALSGLLLITSIIAGCGSTGQEGTPESPENTAGTNPTPSGSTPAGSKRAKVGQALLVTDASGLKAKVTPTSFATHKEGSGQFAEKPKNGLFAVANVKIAVESGDYDFNPLYFKLVISGDAYDAFDGNAMFSGFEPMLDAGTLRAGQSTGGYVVFDVPGPRGVLQLTDPIGGVVGEWNV